MADLREQTLGYYEQNAESFTAGTQSLVFSETHEKFLALLPEKARILDFGCGSGRDTKAFLSRGYDVDAVDGSEKLCEVASAYTGIPVRRLLFSELDAVDAYDGIWACASILHETKEGLRTLFPKIMRALKARGVLYASFKYGDLEGCRETRYFTDFTEESFEAFAASLSLPGRRTYWITSDVRPGRHGERWLNILWEKGEGTDGVQ